jgi:hypothetical protein
MKFGGNTSWVKDDPQNLKIFDQVLAEQERFLVKTVKIYVNFQNFAKSPISIGFSKIKFF